MVKAKINNIEVSVEKGTTILEAARSININVPALCLHPDLTPTASCGLCTVKMKNNGRMVRACAAPLENGMDIITHDNELQEIRRTVLELILSNHPNDCLKCGRNGHCELQKMSSDFGIRDIPFQLKVKDLPKDSSTCTIRLEPAKCILCGRCVQVCQEKQDVWALSFLERGFDTQISPAGKIQLSDSPCVRCGQCSAHCPTGAIFEYDQTRQVWASLKKEDVYNVVQIAPAVRVAIGEAFGYEPGTNLTGKIYTALRMLGFDAVFDTNFSADLTIMEEGSEFVQRFTQGGVLPLITTCCPAWVDFMEKYEGDMIPHFSSAKSPQEMMGAVAKTYYAEKKGLDNKKMFVASIMPCTAKKYEVSRNHNPILSDSDFVDVALTTRELARMIKQAGIDFNSLPDSEPDHILADYTGAGTIFGATGGVMEAALRTAYNLVTKEDLKDVNFNETRGLEGIKEAEVDIKGTKVRIAVAHGLGNVRAVLNKIRDAKAKGEELPYHFVEVMACAGGCVGGGGQPYGATDEIRAKRAKGLYDEDTAAEIRCSHHNPMIKKIYEDYFGAPLSEKAHQLLHTHYTDRQVYKK